MAMAPGLLT
ncbi:hypothetical protein IHE44_0007348 [Lamprotornis superbus]|uniref:Uncharacterized protein n=1 Tax=Lamprotornis superbus TaxID=245042 RepID=A0A835NY58_9PASS|nr:hypothetical protein IHE44_0007348 [Lamprotornis superbus]